MIFLGARQLHWGFHYLFWWDSYTSRIPSHVRIPGHHQDVRFWKDRLLFQIRRFREITGRSLHKGQKAFDDVPDVVEKDGVDTLDQKCRLTLSGQNFPAPYNASK